VALSSTPAAAPPAPAAVSGALSTAAPAPSGAAAECGGPGLTARVLLRPAVPPPSGAAVSASWTAHGLPQVEYAEPFYGRAEDKPARPATFAGREFR
jgi:hypothetical protein